MSDLGELQYVSGLFLSMNGFSLFSPSSCALVSPTTNKQNAIHESCIVGIRDLMNSLDGSYSV